MEKCIFCGLKTEEESDNMIAGHTCCKKCIVYAKKIWNDGYSTARNTCSRIIQEKNRIIRRKK